MIDLQAYIDKQRELIAEKENFIHENLFSDEAIAARERNRSAIKKCVQISPNSE